MAVLIKGKSISCSQKSRNHYLLGKENEYITVREILDEQIAQKLA